MNYGNDSDDSLQKQTEHSRLIASFTDVKI